MDKNNFQVVVTNQLKPEQDKNLITEKLAALFKIDTDKAAQLLIKPRTVIKDNLDEATARKYHAAIRQTGATCEIINKLDAIDLPQIVVPPKSDPETPQPRAGTRASRQSHQEAPLSLVEREEKSEKETREKLSTLQHANEQTLCPDCGTIRGSVDAICLHCGYNPFEIEAAKKPFTRNPLLITGAIVLLVLVIVTIVGLPYFQKFISLRKINDDLKLAFDVRNQVSEFINQTRFFPNQNMDANLPDDISNDTIESIVVSDNGVLTVTLRAAVINETESQTLIFVPKPIKGAIAWNCLDGTLRNDLRPEVCRKSPQK